MDDSSKKTIFVCKACAERRGVSTETPAMWHICGVCGDGPCDLYEADAATFSDRRTNAPMPAEETREDAK